MFKIIEVLMALIVSMALAIFIGAVSLWIILLIAHGLASLLERVIGAYIYVDTQMVATVFVGVVLSYIIYKLYVNGRKPSNESDEDEES